MKRIILTLIVVLLTAPAQAAFLGENSRLGESFLNTGIEQVAGDVSREGPPSFGGAWLRGASEFFVAPTSLEGTKVYRVWGDGSGPYGRSWTPVNPGSVPNCRSAAGLPVQNTGRFVTEGVITDATGVTTRGAIPLHGNPGGLPEIVVPNPSTQIRIIRVGGANPEV